MKVCVISKLHFSVSIFHPLVGLGPHPLTEDPPHIGYILQRQAVHVHLAGRMGML